jgi:leucine-zipper of insertion element IS481
LRVPRSAWAVETPSREGTLMAHANARLTEFGGLLLVQRVLELGWPPAQAAEALGYRGRLPTSGLAATAPTGWPTAAPGPSLPLRAARRPGASGAGRAPPSSPGTPSAGLAVGHASLNHLWGASPPRPEPAGPHRPCQRGGGPLPARAEEADTVLVELGLVEQRYRAVLEVLDDGATVVEVARRYGLAGRPCTPGCAGTRLEVWVGWPTRAPSRPPAHIRSPQRWRRGWWCDGGRIRAGGRAAS